MSDSITQLMFPERVASQVSSKGFHHSFVSEDNGGWVPNKLLAVCLDRVV